MFQAEGDIDQFMSETHSFDDYCKEVAKYHSLTEEITYNMQKVNAWGIITKTRKERNYYLTTRSSHFIYGYMVKDNSDSKKRNQLLLQGFFYMHHAIFFVTSVMEHWLE